MDGNDGDPVGIPRGGEQETDVAGIPRDLKEMQKRTHILP